MVFKSQRRKAQIKPTKEPRKLKQTRVAQFSVSCFARLKPNGRDAVIYCRLVNDGERLQFSTDIHCKSRDFDAKTLTIQGMPEQSVLLQVLTTNALKAVAQLRTFGQPIELEMVKKMTLGESLQTNETPGLIRAFALFLERSAKESQTGTIDAETYKQHERWAKLIGEYFTSLFGSKYCLSDVKPADANDLRLWLKLEKGHGDIYSTKVVQHCKRMFNFAIEHLWLQHNPFMGFKGNRKPKAKEHLTQRELELLAATTKLNPALRRVLDVFLFCSYSGFAWRDTEQLTPEHIKTDETTGIRYILKYRQKSGTPAQVPILPEAQRLLDKWANHPQCKAKGRLVPVPANQTMNNMLREVAAIVGIYKPLTTHIARHTFVNLAYDRGIPPKIIAAIVGHSSVSTLEKHYLRLKPGKIIQAVKAVYPDLGKSAPDQDTTTNPQAE